LQSKRLRMGALSQPGYLLSSQPHAQNYMPILFATHTALYANDQVLQPQ